jgi:hypothetical protein
VLATWVSPFYVLVWCVYEAGISFLATGYVSCLLTYTRNPYSREVNWAGMPAWREGGWERIYSNGWKGKCR